MQAFTDRLAATLATLANASRTRPITGAQCAMLAECVHYLASVHIVPVVTGANVHGRTCGITLFDDAAPGIAHYYRFNADRFIILADGRTRGAVPVYHHAHGNV